MDWQHTKTRIKEEFDKQPAVVLGAAGMFLTGAAKLIDATFGARSKNAYARRMNQNSRSRYPRR